MKSKTILWLCIAAALILVGSCLFGGAVFALQKELNQQSALEVETVRHKISEPFQNISVVTDIADIIFVPSQTEGAAVIIRQQKNMTHSVAVREGALVVEAVDNRQWYEHIGIFFHSPIQILLELPADASGALELTNTTGNTELPADFCFEAITVTQSTGNITCRASANGPVILKTTTGNVVAENMEAESLELSASTGKVILNGVTAAGNISVRLSTGKVSASGVNCAYFTSTGTTGDIALKNVFAPMGLHIERTTGDVAVDRCDSNGTVIETSTGNVTVHFLTPKTYFTETNTGHVTAPEITGPAPCHITTTTGDIKIYEP